jgi:hypothetical protein
MSSIPMELIGHTTSNDSLRESYNMDRGLSVCLFSARIKEKGTAFAQSLKELLRNVDYKSVIRLVIAGSKPKIMDFMIGRARIAIEWQLN